jgi:hypothetical protein
MATTDSVSTAERKRALATERKRRQRGRMAAADVAPSRQAKTVKRDESRVASRSKRDPSLALYRGRLTNPDRTLVKFGTSDGIGLYTRVLHQFANVAGYCKAWIDHVLVTDRAIKPATSEDPEEQKLADEAAERMRKAWARVRNRSIVLQKLLTGRFYGFARAEKVWRFDEVVGEYIQDLYDVDQEFWRFDDEGREFLITSLNPAGIEVDPERFIHFQWGSADTKYGSGDLSLVYRALWTIQQLETMALRRIEDNESTVIVHTPRTFSKGERGDLETAYAEEYQKVILVPTDEMTVRTELPTMNITTSGAAGRQEYQAIEFYERWIQTLLLGAPQTGNKSMGTGKLEDTRKEVWDDKTPFGSAALDACLTTGWGDAYCRMNLASLSPKLRPRFESDTTEVTQGLGGLAASTAADVADRLAKRQITATVAVELWTAIGISQVRAKAMADSTLKEIKDLKPIEAPKPFGAPPDTQPDQEPDDSEEETEKEAA